MNALDVLNLATFSQKIEDLVRTTSQDLLRGWRKDAPGKKDDEILRDKLVECGWKYSRREGQWYHPKVREELGTCFRAPATLRDLAKLIAQRLVSDAMKKMGS